MLPRALILCLLLGCGATPPPEEAGCPESKPRVGATCAGERVCTYLVSSKFEQLLERVGLRTDAGCAEVLSCSALGKWQTRGSIHCI